jgi:thioredoxin 1
MIEVLPDELTEVNDEMNVVFFHTPLCGTCKVAKRMLEIVEVAAKISIKSCNINTASHIAEKYSIESVPCLIVMNRDEIKDKIYAFHSVDYLYKLLLNGSGS